MFLRHTIYYVVVLVGFQRHWLSCLCALIAIGIEKPGVKKITSVRTINYFPNICMNGWFQVFFLERTKRRGKKECTPIPTTHPSNSYLLLHIQPPPLHYSCLISSITHSADYYVITTMTVRVKTFLSCKFVIVFDRPMLSDICQQFKHQHPTLFSSPKKCSLPPKKLSINIDIIRL